MFESHITVEGVSSEYFVQFCRDLGVKPVLIDMDTGSGKSQMMTAKFHKTMDMRRAMTEMMAISLNFERIVRRKLEYIIPKNYTKLPPHEYLEFHAKYSLGVHEVEAFIAAVEKAGGHTSRNAFKPAHDNKQFHFATARDEVVWNDMQSALAGYERVNAIRECVVYDDNPSMDAFWCDGCAFKRI